MHTSAFRAAILALGLLYSSPSPAEVMAEYQFSGEWVGAAYSDDSTGSFSHCAVSADYNSGLSLLVSVSADFGWSLGLVGEGWGLPVGETSVTYRFDDLVWRRAAATVTDPEFVIVPMPDDGTVIDLFRRSRQMQMTLLGSDYLFNLDGTAKVILELAQCVEAFLGRSVQPGDTRVAAAPSATAGREGDDSNWGSGTGILVSASGYVLTNNHVVQSCRAITVTMSGAAAKTASLIRVDEANDLALLKAEGLFSAADVATFRVGSPLQAGETVAVYGYPLAGMLSQAGNVVSGNITALSGLGDDVRFVQISAPIQPGNSGGPLVDAGGLVVGVVNARMNDVAVLGVTGSLPQNVNFAIRGNVAMNFLDAHSIPYRTASSAPDVTLVDIAARAKRFAVFIRCEG